MSPKEYEKYLQSLSDRRTRLKDRRKHNYTLTIFEDLTESYDPRLVKDIALYTILLVLACAIVYNM